MKNRRSFFFLLFLLTWCLGLSLPAQAHWVLDSYEVVKKSSEIDYQRDIYGHLTIRPEKADLTYNQPAYDGGGPSTVGASSALHFEAANYNFPGSYKNKLNLSVTPIFKWLGGGEPTRGVRYKESCSIYTSRSHDSHDGPGGGSPYLAGYSYEGNEFSVDLKMPKPWQSKPRQFYIGQDAGGYQSVIGSTESDTYVHDQEIETTGTTWRGETRTFVGNVTAQGINLGNAHYGTPPSMTGSISVNYQAVLTNFQLDVSTGGEIRRTLDKPRDKKLDAYAYKSWSGVSDIEAAIKSHWGANGAYSATISPDLLSELNNPTYTWDAQGEGSYVIETRNTDGGTVQGAPENLVNESTPSKDLVHNLSESYKWTGPAQVKVSVKVKGNNPQKSELTAKAKIDWYPDPTTRFRSESKFDLLDLDAVTVTPFDPNAAGTTGDDEQAQLDAYIAEIEAKKQETFETGQALISVAFEAEMMVGSWYVPDESDLIIPVAGHVVGRIYKSAKKLRVLEKVLDKATTVGEKALAAAKKKRLANGESGNIVIRITNSAEKEGRLGHVSPGSQLGEDAVEDAEKAAKRVFVGTSCFVAGTVIDTEAGLRAIETLKVGDKVWSRDEDSGKVELKSVTKTFVRQAPATLALTFSNGEVVETTAEHPFFVQDKGFTPAGLVALGNSIVTRAGPCLQVTGIEKKDKPQTVYNFTVADFHTYFVGNGIVWVHNLDCNELRRKAAELAEQLNAPLSKDRPGMTVAIEVGEIPNGVVGRSKKGLTDKQWDDMIPQEVKNLYANVPGSHPGVCAETHALAQIFSVYHAKYGDNWKTVLKNEARVSKQSFAIKVGGPDHGEARSACASCQAVFEDLNIRDIGSLFDESIR